MPTAGEIAGLKEAAERAMQEDASPADAGSRERLLQLYRDAMQSRGHFELAGKLQSGDPFGIEDLEGVEWLVRLAGAGHVAAAALLDRTLDHDRLPLLRTEAPERMLRLSMTQPSLARFLARSALNIGKSRDYAVIANLLDTGGPDYRQIGEALRALCTLAGAPNDDELGLLIKAADRRAYANEKTTDLAGDLLAEFAFRRLLSKDAGERTACAGLLRRAAELHRPARTRQLEWFANLVATAPAYMHAWIGRHKNPFLQSIVARMEAGVAFETGEATGAPDLAEAIRWYEWALSREAWVSMEGGALRETFPCNLAEAIERRVVPQHPARIALMRAWHERGLEAGDWRGFRWCLTAWVGEHPSIEADAATATAHVMRFAAAVGSIPLEKVPEPFLERIVANAQFALRAATREATAQAIGWLELGVLLDEPRSRFLLGALHFNGERVPRDLEKARRQFEAAAARSYQPAVKALERWRSVQA